MNGRIVEFIYYLLPDVIEQVSPFFGFLPFELGIVAHTFQLAGIHIHFRDLSAGKQVQVSAVFTHNESTASFVQFG